MITPKLAAAAAGLDSSLTQLLERVLNKTMPATHPIEGSLHDLIHALYAHIQNLASASENYRKTLLLIGAQHPAWSSDPDDKLVRIFNEITASAREAVSAIGDNDDAKADWCSDQYEKEGA